MTISNQQQWLVDTDIQIHSLIGDKSVVDAVISLKNQHSPCALSAFSKVEFKGNVIQDLCLVVRKIKDSDSIAEAVQRILATGGRKTSRMFALLCQHFEMDFTRPWTQVQGQLMTILDSELFVLWKKFTNGITNILDEFNCSRAKEEPVFQGNVRNTSIPRCRLDNTNCSIRQFFNHHLDELKELNRYLSNIPTGELTSELKVIVDVIEETITQGDFPWHGTTCRRIGDLLIALQSKQCEGLISSNKKEHALMHSSLGYSFIEFPVAKYRLK